MGQCRATKRDGTRCTQTVTAQNGLCWAHDPANAEQRRRSASRAGRSKPSRELAEIKRGIRRVIAAVDSGEMERGVGSVVGQLYNVLLRACEVERRESEESLEERIFHLETPLERLMESEARWGA
jgi:hypothetical protein